MNSKQQHIIFNTLKQMMLEQAPPAGDAKKTSLETDAAPSSAQDSPFTPAEEKFLGKFDAYGSQHLGIMYSISDVGVREFIARSGNDFNLTPGILLKLLRDKIIKIIPYTGWGRNDDYTIELQLSLDDVKGLGAKDKEKVEGGPDASGAPAPGGDTPPPAPEVAWVVRYGDILSESAKIAKQLIRKQNIMESKTKSHVTDVYVKDSRMLKQLPKQYIKHLEQLIMVLSKKRKTASEKQRLIADILDNLSINFELTDKQIAKSYEMHKKQKRLQKYLDKK
jgi:hypothetical protein